MAPSRNPKESAQSVCVLSRREIAMHLSAPSRNRPPTISSPHEADGWLGRTR